MNQSTESPPATQFFGDDDYNYLTANLTGNEWVSAKSALKNSDLFSIINQLSNDLATVRLTANKRMQGIIDNPTNNSNRLVFINQSSLNCFWVVRLSLIAGVMRTDVTLNGNF